MDFWEEFQQQVLDKHSLVLLKALLKERGPDWNHINSFNVGVRRDLSNLRGVKIQPVELRDGSVLHFRFGDVGYRRPVIIEDNMREVKLTPLLARSRKENYCARMYVDVHVFILRNVNVELTEEVVNLGYLRRKKQPLIFPEEKQQQQRHNDDLDDGTPHLELVTGITHYVEPMVYLTAFPVMTQSFLCRLEGLPTERLQEMGESIYELGGVFIMRGKDRVIVPQKNMAKNALFISVDDPSGCNDVTKVVYSGTIHCCGEDVSAQRVVNRVIVGYEKDFQDTTVRVAVTHVYAGKGLPLGILLAALGMSDWNTVVYHIAAFARLSIDQVNRLLHGTDTLSRLEMEDSTDRSAVHRAWDWIADRVSPKQRFFSSDPLPEHPTEAKKTASYQVIHNWFLPHVMDGQPTMRSEQDFWAVCRVKAYMLCKLTADVLRVVIGIDKATDKDRMENKRYDSPGCLLINHLFREYLRPQLSDFRGQIVNMDRNGKPIDIPGAMSSERLQKGLASGIQSGKFHISKRGGRGGGSGSATNGVSQAYSNLNKLAEASHLKKVAQAGNQKTPANARQLNTSQWSFLCPFETPEGQPCGIVNHMAMLSYVSIDYPTETVLEWFHRNVPDAVSIINMAFNPADWVVLVNGKLAFSIKCEDEVLLAPDASMTGAPVSNTRIQTIVSAFKEDRFSGAMPRDISISIGNTDLREIKVWCDGGRPVRPVCIVRDGALGITRADVDAMTSTPAGAGGLRSCSIEDLFLAGKLELLDGAETEDSLMATFYSETYNENNELRRYYTHCEVSPVSIVGLSAGLIPFADRNQSPRNVYQAGMGKQALGTPCLPLDGNLRPTQHVLEQPEHPLVDTVLHQVDSLPFKWMPAGQNCTVFVNTYAHNVEDSLVLNRAFIQRGGLASYTDRTYIQTSQPDTHNTMERELFERPDPERTSNYKTEARYDKIEADGLPVPGEMITSETIIIGKTGPLATPLQNNPGARNQTIDTSNMHMDPNHTRKDQSMMPRKKGGGMVQNVTISHARDNKCASVTIRSHRSPQIGDKLAARHGQKGIVSKIADIDQMPMALDGTTPDIIMNSHAYPSRMTVGQTLEGGLGNVAAINGCARDATMFFGPSRDGISEELFMLKLDTNSEKRVIDPKTGELMPGALYEGTIYYQALKHLVEEKVHARARGPVTKANKQPVEGRRRDGGLRIGEMEKETLIAHGAAALAEERTCGVSDAFRIPICENCGRFAHRVPTNHLSYRCLNCDSHDNIKLEIIPYVLKQFVHYLLAMGIDATFEYGVRRDAVQ